MNTHICYVYATTFHESPKVKVSVYVAKDIHSYSLTHSIHVWYIYLHEWLICMVNVGLNIAYMDGMVWGIYPKYIISSSLNTRHLVFLRSNVSKSKSKQRLRSKCNVDDSNLADADVRLRVTSRETLWVHGPWCFLVFFSIFCPFFKYLYPGSQNLLKEDSPQFWMINVPYCITCIT